MKITKIGIVGSGNIGGNLGILLSKAGYEVCFSSRHPENLTELLPDAGSAARVGTVAEAIAFGDVVLLSIPLKAYRDLDNETKQALKGKIVIDTSNPYPDRDGAMALEARQDPGGMGSVVARLLPGARIVRAFNTVYFEDLKRTVNQNGDRIGIPIAGDDLEAVDAAVELARSVGLDPVVVGGLTASKLFDVGTSVYATSASAPEIKAKLRME
ncbi:NAD(P)-binding domain-containing protein [Geomonas oryzisoli]|uniref:NAD(P)-binding domain-containing protein n=1 Tax=Geomonas oryzisoli TaxID=2847992 RepID=A0ABX8J4A0_9BACT|nr:NAD(P)-binding domain-containing protein [Geomonas oryzisoli]QWV92384.1 NAD(P)-binding domain-containing protein [Geomonas oryzisoli]